MFDLKYLEMIAAPYLKRLYIDIKNIDGDMVIILYFDQKEHYRVSLNDLNKSLHKGVIFDDNKLTSPDR